MDPVQVGLSRRKKTMGKLDKEQEARMAGMRYALGIAEKKVLMDCEKNCR